MYAQRVNRRVRETNRRKQSRYSPSASIGNHCNPSTAFQLDRRLFERSILPVALANGWVPSQSPPSNPTDFVYDSVPLNVSSGDTSLSFNESDNVLGIYINVTLGSTSSRKITLVYANGTSRSYNFFNQSNLSGRRVIYINPFTVTGYGDTDTSNIVSDPVESYIVGVTLQNMTIYVSSSVSNVAFVVRYDTTQPSTVNNFTADRMVYNFN